MNPKQNVTPTVDEVVLTIQDHLAMLRATIIQQNNVIKELQTENNKLKAEKVEPKEND